MAVSGSYDFGMTGDELIASSMRVLKLIATGETPSDTEYTDARQALNMMIKAWQANGTGLWLNQEITMFLADGETSYTLGPSGDHASATTVKTEVSTAAVKGASSLILDSITGMTNADAIGVELDDGTLQWTTINGVPASLTVVLAAVLTDSVAVDNHVYTYTDLIQRPLEIIEARIKNESDFETKLWPISRADYMDIVQKTSEGIANQFYYDPQLTNGIIRVWPACGDVQDRLVMSIRRPIADFDAADDDAEFPQEWLRTLKYNLAVDLAPEFGVEPSPTVLALAISSRDDAEGFDVEDASVQFVPDVREGPFGQRW